MTTYTVIRGPYPPLDVSIELKAEQPIENRDEVLVHLRATHEALDRELKLHRNGTEGHAALLKLRAAADGLRQRFQQFDRQRFGRQPTDE